MTKSKEEDKLKKELKKLLKSIWDNKKNKKWELKKIEELKKIYWLVVDLISKKWGQRTREWPKSKKSLKKHQN